MGQDTGAKKGLLRKVRREFSRSRGLGQVRINFYPQELRRVALAALAAGFSHPEVVRAAGISWGSLQNWTRGEKPSVAHAAPPQLSTPKPVQLKVLKQRPRKREPAVRANRPAAEPAALVRIRFRGGAKMELPFSALSRDLIVALNGGAP